MDISQNTTLNELDIAKGFFNQQSFKGFKGSYGLGVPDLNGKIFIRQDFIGKGQISFCNTFSPGNGEQCSICRSQRLLVLYQVKRF